MLRENSNRFKYRLKMNDFVDEHAELGGMVITPVNTSKVKGKSKKVAKPKTKPTYAILGCGSMGFAVANELKKEGKEFVIVDSDAKRVETLRDQKFEAILGDIGDSKTLKKARLDKLNAVIILSPDVRANKGALKMIKKAVPNILTVVRAADPVTKEELETAGADMVFLPSSVIADTAVRYLERVESVRHGRELLKLIKGVGKKKLGIVIHDNPDPDAIASGLALRYMAAHVGVDAEVLYRGEIGHQENRALVNLLNIPLRQTEELNLDEFDKMALVDVAIPGVNNALPEDAEVEIVIDHHPVETEKGIAQYWDVRPNMGATATIMTGYLQDLNISISKELATALLYGIRTDTREFRRGVDPADLNAAAFLYPLVDHDILEQIGAPSMSAETLDILGEAIKNRRIKGSYLISNVGSVRDRDAIPQAADYLLGLEGITTAIVFGLGEDKIYISGRSKDIRLNIGGIMDKAFGEIGSAGGHTTAGAAQIPLGMFSGVKDRQTLMRLAEESVMKRFFAVVGVEKEKE